MEGTLNCSGIVEDRSGQPELTRRNSVGIQQVHSATIPVPMNRHTIATGQENVALLSGRVRNAIQNSVNEMVSIRPSLFFGSAFASQQSPSPSNVELNRLHPDQKVA